MTVALARLWRVRLQECGDEFSHTLKVPSGVRLDAKILGVSVEPDVVKNRIVEFVSKLALK